MLFWNPKFALYVVTTSRGREQEHLFEKPIVKALVFNKVSHEGRFSRATFTTNNYTTPQRGDVHVFIGRQRRLFDVIFTGFNLVDGHVRQFTIVLLVIEFPLHFHCTID